MIFRFDAKGKAAEFDAEIKRFFQAYFSLERVTLFRPEDKLKFVSKNGMVVYEFGVDFVEFSVKQPEYVKYERLSEYEKPVLDYLQLFGINELSKLVMYKYNQLEYQAEDTYQVKEIMDNVFSDKLTSDIEEGGLDDYTRWEKTKLIQDDSGQSQFTIEYGFRQDAQGQNTGFLTLKTQIESIGEGIALTDVKREMEAFNQILDNGFHWCVNPKIINIMNKA